MLRTVDFDYDLPEHRIAQFPLAQRDASRLLVADRDDSNGVLISDRIFRDLPSVFGELFGSSPSRSLQGAPLVILNESKVYAARVPIVRVRPGGQAAGEVFLLEFNPQEAHEAGQCVSALLRPQKKIRVGDLLHARAPSGGAGEALFEVIETGDQNCRVRTLRPLFEILDGYGQMPLPPYIRREPQTGSAPQAPEAAEPEASDTWGAFDRERYQTVYAGTLGSAAAPTAGLHLTRELMETLESQGLASFAQVTLHVGLGTFRPVQCEQISDHQMHGERYTISQKSLEAILEALEQERPIVFLGTTSFRATESFFLEALSLWQRSKDTESPLPERLFLDESFKHVLRQEAGTEKVTELYIFPGCSVGRGSVAAEGVPHEDRLTYAPMIGHALITNFHQPKSTLLMLVAALVGLGPMRAIYDHALRQGYRFLSYGDASILSFAERPRVMGRPL